MFASVGFSPLQHLLHISSLRVRLEVNGKTVDVFLLDKQIETRNSITNSVRLTDFQ